MPWKMEEGHIAVAESGRPLWVYPDGKEAEFDAEHTLGTITRLNGEAKGHREAKEAAEGKLKLFEGIEDPAAALDAMQKVKNLSAGELKTAEQVAEMQKAAQKAAEEQVRAAHESSGRKIKDLESTVSKLDRELYGEKVGGAFSRSKYIAEKLAAPVDMVQAMFQNRFKIEEGKIVGHDASGNKIWSRVRNGEVANFEEAMEAIVDAYPNRDLILKGSGASGGGTQHNNRQGSGGRRVVTRAEFEGMRPDQKIDAAKNCEIVD